MDKLDIPEYLKQYLNEDIVYMPNPGNAGDSLIAHGANQIFDRIGLICKEGNIDSTYEGKTILYGGGGNLVPPYKNALRFIENNHQKAKKLVVLSHTIQGYPEMLGSLGANVDLICREKFSYQYVKSHVTKANVFIADDLALYINVGETLNDGDKRFSFNDQFFIRNLKRKVRATSYAVKNILSRDVLNSFRTDVEKTDIPIPFNNIDISQAFAADNLSKLFSQETAYRVFKFMENFNTINTNRLHISIAGALLGKKVNFYPNSYNKNFSIYDYSMRNRFKNVTFIDH